MRRAPPHAAPPHPHSNATASSIVPREPANILNSSPKIIRPPHAAPPHADHDEALCPNCAPRERKHATRGGRGAEGRYIQFRAI